MGEFSLGFVPITKRGLKKLARSLGRAESLGIHASLSFFWESHSTVINGKTLTTSVIRPPPV